MSQIETRLLHTGTPDFDGGTGTAPVSVPVVRTSTVRYASVAAHDDLHHRRAAGERVASYGRHGLDTHRALEDAISALEGATRTLLLPSGLSAISYTFLALLSPGDHVLITDSVYSPVRRIEQVLLQRLGIKVSYFSPAQSRIADHVRPETRLVYAESPGSLLFEVLDLPDLAAQAQRLGLPLAVDNTWASGYLLRPLDLGADISIIAGTKYIGGHSDLMLGAVAVRDAALASRVAQANDALGLTIGADDAALALRGVRTLPVRLAQHGRNALEVARHLEAHPAVARAYHPALPSDPGHALWQRDFWGANGLVSVELNLSPGAARTFVDSLTYFAIGASWGGYESLALPVDPRRLAEHAAWTSDRPVVRLHIGLEAPADLIADLDRALGIATAGEAAPHRSAPAA